MKAEQKNTKELILTISIPLFASAGYAGVSIRQIAKEVGIKAASIYSHFPNKQTIYIEALALAFGKYSAIFTETSSTQSSPEQQLQNIIKQFCILVSKDTDFTLLIQREIMEGDRERLQLLAKQVFGDFFNNINELCVTIRPDRDPHLMTVSIIGMIMYHFQISPIRCFFTDYKSSHDDPEVIAKHVFEMIGCSEISYTPSI